MKIRRLLILLVVLALIGVVVFVAPAIALADCSPSPTGGSDDINCSGTHFGSVNAGNGDDAVTVNPGATVTRDIDGGNGSDTITNNGRVGDDILGGRGDDQVDNYGNVSDDIDGENNNDTINNHSTGTAADLLGGGGDDTILNEGTVRNTIDGEDGDDDITNNGTTRNLQGGRDDDTILNEGAVWNTIDGEDGNDDITNNGITRNLQGGRDDDTILNEGTVWNTIDGEAGNDDITNNGTVLDDINGGNNNDTITVNGRVDGDVSGGFGNDTVIVEDGATTVDNTFRDGDGRNTLTFDGGWGTDEIDFELHATDDADQAELESEFAAGQATMDAPGFNSNFNYVSVALTLRNVVYRWIRFEELVYNIFASEPEPDPEPAGDGGGSHDAGATDPCFFNDGTNLAISRTDEGDLVFLRLKDNEGMFHSFIEAEELGAVGSGQVALDNVDPEGYRLRVTRMPEGDFTIELFSPGTSEEGTLGLTGPDAAPLTYRMPL
jgi:hypothetical protein